MKRKFLANIILWLLFQLLVEINCQMTPGRREHHTATHVDNKLYILGGSPIGDNDPGQDFFYLDVSVTFDTKKLSWQDKRDANTIPSHSFAASVKGGTNNNTLFLYGGKPTSPESIMNLIYRFNPQSNSWIIPYIVGEKPAIRFDLTGIINNDGKSYLFGGRDLDNFIKNEMIILDTINLSWGLGNLDGAPTPRCSYGAVLLPNNNIIYTGKQVIFVMLVFSFFKYLLLFRWF
jgi:N-acetylneuraminic acid mutarotase